MNTVYRRKIKNRKKKTGNVWLIEAHTKHTLPFNCNNTKKDKTKTPKAPFDEGKGT